MGRWVSHVFSHPPTHPPTYSNPSPAEEEEKEEEEEEEEEAWADGYVLSHPPTYLCVLQQLIRTAVFSSIHPIPFFFSLSTHPPTHPPTETQQVDGAGSKTQWQSLLNRLKKDGLLPCVVFNFSKKKCEECADYLGGEDLNAAKEKSQVSPPTHPPTHLLHQLIHFTVVSSSIYPPTHPPTQVHIFATSAIKRLQAKDQKLPQVPTHPPTHPPTHYLQYLLYTTFSSTHPPRSFKPPPPPPPPPPTHPPTHPFRSFVSSTSASAASGCTTADSSPS